MIFTDTVFNYFDVFIYFSFGLFLYCSFVYILFFFYICSFEITHTATRLSECLTPNPNDFERVRTTQADCGNFIHLDCQCLV